MKLRKQNELGRMMLHGHDARLTQWHSPLDNTAPTSIEI